jgi:hypothetical protein
MRTATLSMIAVFLTLSVLVPTPVARGDILDDILKIVKQGRDNAAAARDGATEARNNAASARDRAIEARDNARETRDHLREGLARMTDQMRTAFDEAVEDIERLLAEHFEGRDDFVRDGGCSLDVCEPFRRDLAATLQNLEDIMNLLYDIAGVEGMNADFQKLINLIEQVPGRVLFPLYKVLVEQNNVFDGGLLDVLPQAVEALRTLKEAMDQLRSETPEGDGDRLDLELGTCEFWDSRLPLLRTANTINTAAAALCRIIGESLEALGTTSFHGEFGVSVVDGAIHSNLVKKIGIGFNGASQVMFVVGSFVTGKTRHCTQIVVQGLIREEIRTAKSDLTQGQQDILDAIAALNCKGRGADLDGDGDVDLEDYIEFQKQYTGPR